MLRAVKAGLCLAGAGASSAWLYDAKGPERERQTDKLVTVPDFSIPARTGQTMSVVTGPDRVKTLNKAIELLGGIERFVKPGETVFIKPNVAFASPPSLGATTNPELVGELVRLSLQKAGAKEVIVADNPINDPESCFRYSGIGQAAVRYSGTVLLPREQHFRPTTVAGARLIRNWPIFYEPLSKAQKVIGVAPVKNHHRSGASMTMKNWYGLLGGRRNIFHQDINTIIAELAIMVKPTLVILDGTEVMVRNGPTGGSVSDLQRRNTMVASCDEVAADAYGAGLLGISPSELLYLGKAEQAGVGTVDYARLSPIFAEMTG
jgi:uncharacterized protein (DUF362 family)